MLYFWRRSTRLLLLTAFLSRVSAAFAQPDSSTSVVTVHRLDGGRTIGCVDATTDETHLVIRRNSANVVLRARVPWAVVSRIDVNGEILIANAPQDIPKQLMSEGPRSAFAETPLSGLAGRPSEGMTLPDSMHRGSSVVTITPGDSVIETSASALLSRVRSLQLATQLANWDNDAAIDGLLVRVQPLNDRGQIVPTEGRLNLKLVGLTETQGGQVQFGRSPVEFPELETWDQPVRRTDFTPDGAVYRLEFRRLNAERDIAVIPFGMVSARLSVPSVGTFAATEHITLLRPYSLIRDVHQQFRGTRRLPGEFRD
jgi:hypothetical protein